MNKQYRNAAVAGSFYPANAKELTTMVDQFLNKAVQIKTVTCPKVMIVPHAGLIYSGQTAAIAYKQIAKYKEQINKVVLLGPSHKVSFNGIACSNADYYQTPLGDIKLDKTTAEQLIKLPQVNYVDQAHAQEHALEVQLPFLQRVLGNFSLLPLVVGTSQAEQTAQVIEQIWGDKQTLLLISSDLSHFLPYDQAVKKDQDTAINILNYNYTALTGKDACGVRPIQGLLHIAKQKNLKIINVDIRNSGDTAGNKDRVVGYASFLLFENSSSLTQQQKDLLLKTAHQSIKNGLTNGKPIAVNLHQQDVTLSTKGACFVTLHKNGQLRGCIGALSAYRPLIEDVAKNAFSAAFNDPRFKPLTPEELDQITLDISVLTPAKAMQFTDEQDLISQIKPNIDGLILEDKNHRGTFLPSVWKQLPEPKQFLNHLKQKAGLPVDYWSNSLKVSRYQTEIFGNKTIN